MRKLSEIIEECVVIAVQIGCSCCGRMFAICKSCYRNQKYCSDECRKAGYQERHRIAQRKYSSKKDIKKNTERMKLNDGKIKRKENSKLRY